MHLPQLFSKKEIPRDSYFGLFLRGESATGFIFDLENGEVRPVAKESINYSKGWDAVVDDIDQLLSILENETKISVRSCIYFVYSYFVDSGTGNLKEPYNAAMRRISKELDLKPLGYIECHEAVKEMLEKEEGTPLNSLLVEADANHLALYVYKGGKLIHSDHTARTDSIAEDVAEIVERKADQFLLPSRMIVYGSGTLTAELDSLRMYTWKDEVFIQTPRIAGLNTETVLNALSATFMEQMNGEFPGGTAEVNIAQELSESPEPVAPEVRGIPEIVEQDILQSAEKDAPLLETDAHRKGKKTGRPRQKKDEGADEAAKVGFVIGEDVADLPDISPPNSDLNRKLDFIGKISIPSLPAIPLPQVGGKQAGAIVAVLLVLTGLGVAEYSLHKSIVEVYLPSEKISDTIAIEVSAAGKSAVIADSTTIKVSDSIATSGEREVGEKAKGTVTLYNFDIKPVTIPAGAELKVDGITFVLDSDVQVASRSGSVASRTAGTKETTVTAAAIGTESNIAKDKQLNIPSIGSSDVYAVAKETFTGGSKRKLQTVAKSDIDQLEKRVLAKAQEESDQKLKSSSGGKLLADLTELEVIDSNYSGEVGQEAEELSVTATVTVRFYVAKDVSMQNEILSRLKDEVPSGYQIDSDNITYRIASARKNEDAIDMNVLGEAVAVRQVDAGKLARALAGRRTEEARKVLREEFEVEDVVVKANHTPLFFLTGLFPLQAKNISLDFKTR